MVRRDKNGRFVAGPKIGRLFVYFTLGTITAIQLSNLFIELWYSVFPPYGI